MTRSTWNRFAAVAAAGTMALALAACGSDDSTDTASSSSTTAAASPSASASPSMMAGPFGAACTAVPKDGKGSFEGMSADPVATAASNNPLLSTLVAAVKAAGLVDTLNGLSGATVFAPTNDAFAKIPKADLDKVLADKATLTKILTYHVVGSTVTPEQLGTAGPFKTVEGATVSATGSGEAFTVGTQNANVLCGNVKTSNATVYIIDTVLMPPM